MRLAASSAASLLRRAGALHASPSSAVPFGGRTSLEVVLETWHATRQSLPQTIRRAHSQSRANESYAVHSPRSRRKGENADLSSRRPRPQRLQSAGANQPAPLAHSADPEQIRKAMQSLRSAVARRDVDAAWRCWTELQRLDALGRVLTPDLDDIQKMFSTPKQRRDPSSSAEKKSSVPWDDRHWQWALFTAKRGLANLTAKWARLALLADRPDLVAGLLDASGLCRTQSDHALGFKAHPGRQTATSSAEAPLADPAIQDGAVENQQHRASPDQSVRMRHNLYAEQYDAYHDLLAYFVISKVLLDDFAGLIDKLVEIPNDTPNEIFYQHGRVAELARRIFDETYHRKPIQSASPSASTPPSTAPEGSTDAGSEPLRQLNAKLVRYTWHAELARGASVKANASRFLPRLLGAQFHARKLDAAWSIFTAAMEASTGSRPWLLLEKARKGKDNLKSYPLAWTETCWALCLSNFIALGKQDLASQVWTRYHELGLEATPHIWNALLDGYSRARNYEAAEKAFETMRQQGKTLEADAVMYTTMISVLFRSRKVNAALQLFNEMRGRHESSEDPLQIPTETCNAVIHGLCINGSLEEAQAMLAEMQERGPPPTIGTINALLRAYGRNGDLAALAATLRLVEKLQLRPDVVTFTTTLDALLRKGSESAGEAVRKVTSVMESMGVKANAFTYTALIKACLVGSESANIDMAAQNLLPGPWAASAAASNEGEFDVRIDAALDLLDQMLRAQISPTEVTYTALIGAVLAYPHVIAHAFASSRIPTSYTLPATPSAVLHETGATVQQWLTTSPDVSLALLLLDKMKARRLTPVSTTYHYLIRGLARPETDRAALLRALSLIDEMLSTQPATPKRRGPMVTAFLSDSSDEPVGTSGLQIDRAGSLSYDSWMVILTTLCERLEGGAQEPAVLRGVARSIRTALWLMSERAATRLKGLDGGSALIRAADRARELLGTMRI